MFWKNTLFVGYEESGKQHLLNTFKCGKFDVHILYINEKVFNFRIDYYE